MTQRAPDVEHLSFLFTDVERSSAAWLRRSLEMTQCIPAINGIIETVGRDHRGEVFGREGDGRALHFASPHDAVAAAITAQREIAVDVGVTGGLLVRAGIHTGEVYRLSNGELGGTPLNYVGRLHGAGHGGQTVVSDTTKELADPVGESFRWTDLGQYSLRDFAPGRLWQVEPEDSSSTFPPLRTRRRFEPPKPTDVHFVGRSDDLEGVARACERTHATTLTGPGGIGKTSLVRKFVELHGHRFVDGVCFVDLQRVTTPGQVSDSVANRLGVDTAIASSAIGSIQQALAGSDVLVVLDNCEHVSDAAGEIAVALAEMDGPTVVCTSRSPLGVGHEVVYPVGPLRGAADGADDSERLFAIASSPSRPGVAADARSTDLVSRICERLGGIPLAIELAAARVGHLGLEDLLRSLDDDLKLLDGSSSSVDGSLSSALRWSVDRLDDAGRNLGIVLARCHPDAALPELQRLAGHQPLQNIETLERLIAAGIVRATGSVSAYRYRMLHPLRHPFVELEAALPDAGSGAARHAEVYADLARLTSDDIQGAGELAAVVALTADLGNIRSALLHDIDNGKAERAARTACAMHMYGFLRMRYEVYSWVDRVLDSSAELSDELRGELIGMAAFRSFNQGLVDEAMDVAREADALTPGGGPITSRVVLMSGYGMAGEFELANEEFLAGLRWCDERGEPFDRTNLYVIASMGLTSQGLFDSAAGLARRGLRLAEEVANPSAVAWALTALADAIRHDDPAEAARMLESALEIARSVSCRWVEGQALLNLTRAYRCDGSIERARDTCVDALAHCQQRANRIHSRQGVREAFLLLHTLGEHEQARRAMVPLLETVDPLPPSPDQRAVIDRAIEELGRGSGVRYGIGSSTTEREVLGDARSALLQRRTSTVDAN